MHWIWYFVCLGKSAIEQVVQQQPLLKARTWTNIKDFIRNRIKKQSPHSFSHFLATVMLQMQHQRVSWETIPVAGSASVRCRLQLETQTARLYIKHTVTEWQSSRGQQCVYLLKSNFVKSYWHVRKSRVVRFYRNKGVIGTLCLHGTKTLLWILWHGWRRPRSHTGAFVQDVHFLLRRFIQRKTLDSSTLQVGYRLSQYTVQK